MIQIKSAAPGKPLAFLSVVAVLALGLLSAGCASISYKPAVSLPESPRTIKATVQLDPLVDQVSPHDKASQFSGLSACEPQTLQGDLSTGVTDAILTDFNNNQVFATVKKRFDTTPDLIIKGTIDRFGAKFKVTTLGWCTMPIDIIWFFGLPITADHGNVDLTLTIQRPDGTVLGTYRGVSKFAKSYNIYQNAGLALPTRLNKAFSEAVAQLREQILNDESKLTPAPAVVPVK